MLLSPGVTEQPQYIIEAHPDSMHAGWDWILSPSPYGAKDAQTIPYDGVEYSVCYFLEQGLWNHLL